MIILLNVLLIISFLLAIGRFAANNKHEHNYLKFSKCQKSIVALKIVDLIAAVVFAIIMIWFNFVVL